MRELPKGPDNETIRRVRQQLEENAGGLGTLRRRLNGVVGSIAAEFLTHLISWSGHGAAPGGWIYKSRKELESFETGTGQTHWEQETARKILRGDMRFNKRTFRLIEEERPSRRRPVFYRVDLMAVAEAIGVALSESPIKATQEMEDDLADIEWPIKAASVSTFS